MTIKEQLKELKDIDNSITTKLRQVESLRAKAENIGSFELKADSVSGGMVKDYSGSIDMLVDLSNEINVDVDKLVNIKRFWKARVDRLPIKQKNVVERYYFENLTWEQVCVELDYSWSQVHRFHSMALINLKNME